MARKGVSSPTLSSSVSALWVTAVSACVVHFQPVSNVTIGLGSLARRLLLVSFLTGSWAGSYPGRFILLILHYPQGARGQAKLLSCWVAVERAELLGLVVILLPQPWWLATRSRGLSSSTMGLIAAEGMETVVLDTGRTFPEGVTWGSLACGKSTGDIRAGWSLLIHTCVSTEDPSVSAGCSERGREWGVGGWGSGGRGHYLIIREYQTT